MHITARQDYAVQAMLAIAVAGRPWLTAAEIAYGQNIPGKYLPQVLLDLRRARLLASRPGADGGYALGRKASQISIGEIMRAADGALSSIRGRSPEAISYAGPALPLTGFWRLVHEAVLSRVDGTTLQDLISQLNDEDEL